MTRRLLALAVAAALLSGCGDDSPPRLTRAAPTATAASDAPLQVTSPAPATSTAASTGPSPAAPAVTDAPAAASSASAAAPAGSPAVRPAPEPGRTTAPGSYTYDTSGTVTVGSPRRVAGTTVLRVDRPAGGQQHSELEGEQGRTEQDVIARSNGRFLARLSLTNPAFTKEFVLSPPVLLVPTPPSVGRSWSWTATSTDGKTTAALTARVARTETLTIGGVRTPTSVIESTLRLTGDVTYTGRMSTWYDAAHGLTVKERSRGSGTVSGIAFTTDITSVVRSTTPAQ